MSNIDNLIKQIQSQGTTSKWTGGYGAEAATKDMARILDSIGITDINQFGPVTKEVELYMGEGVDGTPIYQKQTEQTFGNKITGQAVPVTYSERQTGNAFGGTFEGKGNTGYRVDFTPDGKPIFYTTGASSSNAAEIIKPFATMALLAAGIGGLESLGLGGAGATGGAAASGAGAAGMTAAELAQLDLALGGLGGSTGATTLGNALMTGASVPTITSLTGGSGLLTGAAGGITADSVAAKLAEGATGMGSGTGLLGAGMTEAELAQLDLALGGSGGSAGAAELGNALATGAPTVTNTALTGGSGIFTGAAGGITPESVAAKLNEGAATASNVANAAKGLGVSDAIRAAGVVATIAGANKALEGGGSGGFPIVPIPSDWTSPIKPTGTAAFTPLAPIDFGNKEMLRGTQWEQLLSPDYGKTPAMPTSTNPSNMTFNELTRILGGSRESIPTQNLTINDVIAGIQSQYGQTPQGSMG
jgi:hypothetical protein